MSSPRERVTARQKKSAQNAKQKSHAKPQSRLRPISPFSDVGQGRKGKREKEEEILHEDTKFLQKITKETKAADLKSLLRDLALVGLASPGG